MPPIPFLETNILVSLDPTNLDTDEWPELKLQNARVCEPDDRTAPVNLLLATEHHPLTVIGDIQPSTLPDTVLQHGVTSRVVPVEITGVKFFAYGQLDNGTIVLWAAGRAGWYAISPSRAYKETYDRMLEAVRMLYFVADAYREEKRIGKGRSASVLQPYNAQELFEKYAEEVLRVPQGAAEAARKAYEHVDFLFTSMLTGKEGIDWPKNPLYQHLKRKFPAEHATVEHRLRGPSKREELGQPSKHQSVDNRSPTNSLKRKRGRPRKELAESALDSISISSGSTSGTVKDLQSAADAPRGQGAAHSKARYGRRTRHTPSAPSEESAERSVPPERAAAPDANASDSEEDAHRARKGRSALRLKPSEGVKGAKAIKGAARSRIAPDPGADDCDDELASSPTISKRKAEDHVDARPQKRCHSKPDVDEGIDMPETPSVEDNAAHEENVPHSPSDAPPGVAEAEDTSEAAAAVLSHVPDPVQEDTWVCALDGCTHKVYLASRSGSQRLIREHYALHAYDEDERVQMVKRLQHPSLPVNHLMEKVRMQARREGFSGSAWNGSRFPPPIVSRY
ncbi:hypothetical protein BAUCODRAFT_146825 [Baudoinia panamericana UAMH 10762]|uniref:DNA (cytosine-5)-methyltransferase 1 replication foci domain-containing protein n=1 Tax=Baudoinia panamericana (strain UAMH 10762) TaxID=717646 RepID=M2NGX9_BAUPA|nr:uncharacterized protein BAUCODRAFT_146825 [Baudoinia panamericana UAMH 10762]EMC98270.1 hypothetical protein BAUCODRAFT_146825 [Baudoinia panamericana UAMH 10762]